MLSKTILRIFDKVVKMSVDLLIYTRFDALFL